LPEKKCARREERIHAKLRPAARASHGEAKLWRSRAAAESNALEDMMALLVMQDTISEASGSKPCLDMYSKESMETVAGTGGNGDKFPYCGGAQGLGFRV
jgi:hypothetical protein